MDKVHTKTWKKAQPGAKQVFRFTVDHNIIQNTC